MRNSTPRVVLVTGAARGIGQAAAQRFLDAGDRVVALDRASVDARQFRVPENSDRFWSYAGDVTDRAAMTALRDAIARRWAPVAVLVNNAAISPKQADGHSARLLDITPQEWESVLAVNLTAALGMAQVFLPGMQAARWGRVVNVASLAGRTRSISAGASYMASKAGLLGLTRAIAAEMGPHGITANAVAPGRIVTQMSMTAGAQANQRIAEQLPVRRLGTVEEVAGAIFYLASEEAGYINGGVIDINGGHFMP